MKQGEVLTMIFYHYGFQQLIKCCRLQLLYLYIYIVHQAYSPVIIIVSFNYTFIQILSFRIFKYTIEDYIF
jgi:hypothetical protein